MEEEEVGEDKEAGGDAKEATPWGEDFFFPFVYHISCFLFFFFCLSHVFVCLKVQRTRMQR